MRPITRNSIKYTMVLNAADDLAGNICQALQISVAKSYDAVSSSKQGFTLRRMTTRQV